jgi:hypothetical protein
MNRVFVTFASRLDVARYHRQVFAHIGQQVGRISGNICTEEESAKSALADHTTRRKAM